MIFFQCLASCLLYITHEMDRGGPRNTKIKGQKIKEEGCCCCCCCCCPCLCNKKCPRSLFTFDGHFNRHAFLCPLKQPDSPKTDLKKIAKLFCVCYIFRTLAFLSVYCLRVSYCSTLCTCVCVCVCERERERQC